MTKHKSSDERRDQILLAARQCFVERGYESTSMRDIATTSGLSKGGIYFHFDSKMQVFLSLVDEEYDRSMAFLEAITRNTDSITVKLSQLAQHFLDHFASNLDRSNFFMVSSEVALREPAVRQKLFDLQSRYIEVLTEFIESAMAAGELRVSNARVMAVYLKCLIDGIEGNTALGLDLDLPSFIPAGVDLLLNGLLPRGRATGEKA